MWLRSDLSILEVPNVWNRQHWWDNSKAGKSRTDVWILQGSTAAVLWPVENAGGVCSRLPERRVTQTHTLLQQCEYYFLQRQCGELSLCLLHFRLRERDSEYCNIYSEASCLICTETLNNHRLWSSPGAFCSICSCLPTAPCRCICSPPHTHTLHSTCSCSSESPSDEILGQNKYIYKNHNRLIDTLSVHDRNPEVAEKRIKQKEWVTVSLLGLQSPEQRLHLPSWFSPVVKLPAGQAAHSVQDFRYSPSRREQESRKSRAGSVYAC